MSRTLELLKSMRSKIASGWTQGCSAQNRQGFPVVASCDDAVRWCLVGSTVANTYLLAGRTHIRTNAWLIIQDLIRNRNETCSMDEWNDRDGRTQEEVLELLDEAITITTTGGYE
jgi:hypothetical protein